MPKVYFNDLGFRNSLLKLYGSVDFRPDKGALIENDALLRLRQFCLNTLFSNRIVDGVYEQNGDE